MANIRLFITLPGSTSRPLSILVEETAYIGACVNFCVQHLKLPQLDHTGKPCVYALQGTSETWSLPNQRRFVDLQIASGTRFQLIHLTNTLSHQQSKNTADSRAAAIPSYADRVPRRSLLVTAGLLALCGLGAGAFTAFAQQSLTTIPPPSSPLPTSASISNPTPQPATLSQRLHFSGHQQNVQVVSWSPDGRLLASGSDDRSVLLWDTTGAIRQRLPHQNAVQALAWSPDGQRLVTAASIQVQFFDIRTGMLLATPVQAHRGPIACLIWTQAAEQPAISGAQDQRAVVWETETYQPRATFTRHQAPIEALSCSQQSAIVASASQGGAVRLWQIETLQEIHGEYQASSAPIRTLAFAPTDSRLIAAGDDGRMRLWNNPLACQQSTIISKQMRCLDPPTTFDISPSAIRTLAWSADGHLLASGSDDGLIAIWHITPQNALTLLTSVRQTQPIRALSWSPDQHLLASASGSSVTLWDAQSLSS